MSRRLTAALALAFAALTLTLTACGGSSSDDQGPTKTAKAEEGALPATIEHKYGSTEVTEAPERIVVTGLREQDALIALGDVPVATTEWYGEKPGAIFSWAEDAVGDAPLPEVLDNTDGIQFEKIARLDPDLIVSVYSDLSKENYETLSEIAPTIAPPEGKIDFGSSWEDEITMVGQAVGKPAEAERIREQTKDLVAATAAEHPEFEGKTAAVATPYEGVWVFGPDDPRSVIMGDLGFEFPEDLKDVGGDEFGGPIPDEQVDKLDLDTVLWFADPGPAAKIKKHPVYRGLDVRKENRDLFMAEKGELYDATNFVTVLSLPILAEGLAPLLSEALDGKGDTAGQS